MSFLEELQAVRDQVLAHSVKELDVPPAGRHTIRFRAPADGEKLTPVIAAYRAVGALTRDQEAQLVIDCCDEILRRNGDGELEPADPEGGPLRFDAGDERWGADVKTARDCVAKLYNLDVQPLATAGHAEVLVDWLQGLDAVIEAQLAGESDGGAPS